VVLPVVAPLLAQAPEAAHAGSQLVQVRDATTGLPLPGVRVRVGQQHEESTSWMVGFTRAHLDGLAEALAEALQ
jgi:hypothetical protein